MSQRSGCYLTETPNLGLTKSVLFLASFTFFFDSSLGLTFALFLLARGQLVSVILILKELWIHFLAGST